MSAIFLPRRWRYQPPRGSAEIDLRNPLTDGLIIFCLGQDQFFPGGLSYTDYNSVSRIYSPEGESLQFASSAYRVANSWIDPAGRYTGALVVGATPAADITDGNRTYIAGARNGATSGSTRLYLRRIGGNIAGFGVNDTAVVTPTENVVWPTGERGIIALSWTVANVFGFFNGRQLYAHGSALSADVNYLTINSLPIGSAGTYAGANIYHFVGVWSRPLSDAEQWEIGQAPYQIFRAPSRRIWFDLVAGASGTTYNESLTESATLGDSLDPLASFFASYAESVTAADSAANAQTHAAALSESVTPADSATTAQSHAEALAESVTAADSAAPAQTMPVAFSESVTAGDALSDEVVPAGSFNETIAESATAEDAYTSTQAHVEALAEQISVGDGYTVTGGTEVEQRRGAPAGSPLRIWRYSARIGGRMVYADTQQALQAAIAEFEDSVPARAEKKAQKAGKVVVRRLPKVQIVEAPEEERGQVQAQAQAANDRIAAEYLAALQAQIAIREAMERDDMEAITVLEFL